MTRLSLTQTWCIEKGDIMDAKLTIAVDISQAEWDILDEVATAEYDGSITKALHKAIRLLKGHYVRRQRKWDIDKKEKERLSTLLELASPLSHAKTEPCLFCGKPSTGAIYVIGDGEVGYACKEHEDNMKL